VQPIDFDCAWAHTSVSPFVPVLLFPAAFLGEVLGITHMSED
jgi:hypothetical protein